MPSLSPVEKPTRRWTVLAYALPRTSEPARRFIVRSTSGEKAKLATKASFPELATGHSLVVSGSADYAADRATLSGLRTTP